MLISSNLDFLTFSMIWATLPREILANEAKDD